HLGPAQLDQRRDIVVIVARHTLVVEPAIGIAVVADLEEGVDQLRPISDAAFEIARHVKGEAEVSRSEPLSANLIGGAAEAGNRVLPIGNKAADDRFEPGIPAVISWPTP